MSRNLVTVVLPEYRRGLRHIRDERELSFRHGKHYRKLLIERHGYQCMACGSKVQLRVDHIRPICLGGKTKISNLQLLCRACDEAKGAQIIDFRPRK